MEKELKDLFKKIEKILWKENRYLHLEISIRKYYHGRQCIEISIYQDIEGGKFGSIYKTNSFKRLKTFVNSKRILKYV